MRRKIKTLSLMIAFCSLMSCIHPGAESMFRVKGNISVPNAGVSQEYILEVYRADTHQLVKRVSIAPEFNESVVIAPGAHKYYMVISRPGTELKYRSPVFELGEVKHYLQPIDLGSVTLMAN